jgi:hypothetical protein
MWRFGSLLTMLLLTAPMVRDCCLPVTHSLPCHGARHTDDVTCSSNAQAIAESKPALGVYVSVQSHAGVAGDAHSTTFPQVRWMADGIIHTAIPATDIYLHTGALLI